MKGSPAFRGAGMLVFTTVAWGAMFAVAKSALGSIDAFWLSAWRYAPASLAMLAILGCFEGRAALRPAGAGFRLWLYGSLGFAGFTVLGFLGLARSHPEHAAIIVALMPLVTALLNWMIRGRRPGTVTCAAMLVAFVGVVLVITKGRLHVSGEGTLPADALMLAAVVCWVAYTMGAATLPQFSTLRYTAQSMAFGSLTIVTIALVATAAGFAHPPAWRVLGSVGGEIAYLSIIAGVLAALSWNAGIALLGPANGVLFINLVPITAFAIGVAQGHRFGAGEIIGAALVIGALVVNSVAGRGTPPRRLASSPKFA
jgi:drug/metabolite transporter (DMT)-like permease